MLRTRNSGFRVTHIPIKTAGGNYFASEEGSPDSSAWIHRHCSLQDSHWRNLLMTDTPTNQTNVRKPDPNLTPVIPQDVGRPDLTKVEEVGFSGLTPGGWIPSTTRVNAWAVYGKKVPRYGSGGYALSGKRKATSAAPLLLPMAVTMYCLPPSM